MKARELAEVLLKDPDAEVNLIWSEFCDGGDGSSYTEDKSEPAVAVFKDEQGFKIAPEFFFSVTQIWPPLENK